MKKGHLPAKALGKRVAIRFRDHAVNSDEEFQCEVTGIVERHSGTEVAIRWWSTFQGDSEESEAEDPNSEIARILQGTIVRWAYCPVKKWNEVA